MTNLKACTALTEAGVIRGVSGQNHKQVLDLKTL